MMVDTEAKRRGSSIEPVRPLVSLGVAIAAAYGVVGLTIWLLLPDWETRGQFGDMFGAANALFSGAALVGVIYAVLLQRKELQLQRQELELTRRELERTAVAQEQSAKGLLEQTTIQTRLLNAQLLKDRWEMYWQTYEPITREQVDEFKLYPHDYMEPELYERRYRGDDSAIRRYIYMSQIYEHLAFTYSLRRLDISDPLGEHWIGTWTRDLLESAEFLDVNEQYCDYYPEFRAFLARIASSVPREDRG